ncbi:MAG: cysteine desulfurase [Rubrobacter sp.]|jgi:cysteine desulfurase|nr:cysteine desulfurase [Rubrobacter sp.]
MTETAKPVYLDNNATTPLDPRVLEEMMPYLTEEFGNPASSTHAFGWNAEAAVDVARERAAEAVGASPEEIIFTSGATESDNAALLGMLRPGDHLITAATEHEAILETAYYLAKAGVEVTVLPVDEHGVVSPDSLRAAMHCETTLVSIMLANNETGTMNPVGELADIAHERGVPFHTDAAQALAKVPVNVEELGVDMMSLSAHKAYGPKGVGALYVRRRTAAGVRRFRLSPLLRGGGQERRMRSGTLNVPGIIGFGKAAELGASSFSEERERLSSLRDRLHEILRQRIPDLRLNGHPERRLPNTLNVSFPGVDVGDLLGAMPDVAASAGSACASLDAEPSHVLEAMGAEDGDSAAIRFSLGRFTKDEEIERVGKTVVEAYEGLAHEKAASRKADG